MLELVDFGLRVRVINSIYNIYQKSSWYRTDFQQNPANFWQISSGFLDIGFCALYPCWGPTFQVSTAKNFIRGKLFFIIIHPKQFLRLMNVPTPIYFQSRPFFLSSPLTFPPPLPLKARNNQYNTGNIQETIITMKK